MKKVKEMVVSKFNALGSRLYIGIENNSSAILAVLGLVILCGGLSSLASAVDGSGVAELSNSDQAYDDELVRGAVANLFKLVEGSFGALIMVVSGLGAIVAAAMGAYKAALGMLVVAVGAFILRSLVSLFFGTGFETVQTSGSD